MQQKNLAKTDGLPLYLGLISALLILFETIMSPGVSIAYTQYMLQKQGITVAIPTASVYGGLIAGFIIYPGIFLILLLVSVNKPRRGKTFAIVWIVLSALSLIQTVFTPLTRKDIFTVAKDMIPGGYYTLLILGVLGIVCMILSCVFLLQRLQKQANAPMTEPESNGTANP